MTMMTPKALVPKKAGSHRISETYPKSASRRYYLHVDGLRGFALALVVIFHVFIGRVSSGVDIFLFIGGLLLISSQLRNAQRPDGLTFSQSIIRILRRLYPALIVMVATGVLLSMMVLPPAQWADMFRHASAAALYCINWIFIQDGESYARAGSDADVFQHLWSMAVQVQIYIFLIALIVICVKIADYFGKEAKRLVTAIVSIFAIASFVFATWMIQYNQVENYYSTFSRFWEIALGGLVGMYLLDKVILSPLLRWISTIVGIVLIVGTGFVINGVEQFPGPLTLVPLTGAMLIIFSGNYGFAETKNWKTMGPVSLFETPFMLWLGRISYSLYLWHWMVLIIASHITDRPQFDIIQGVIVIAISVGLAWVTQKFVEQPLRQKTKPKRATFMQMITGKTKKNHRRSPSIAMRSAATVIVVMISTVAASPGIYAGVEYIKMEQLDRAVTANGGMEVAYPGAKAFTENKPSPENFDILPNPDNEVGMTFPQSQADGCYTNFEGEEIVWNKKDGTPCEYGDTSSKETMYIIGGSHSEMYLPALDEIGKRRGIKMIPMVKMGCALFQNEKWDGSEYPECQVFSESVVNYVLDNPPTKGIFHTSTRPSTVFGEGPETVPAGYIDSMRKFGQKGTPMYLVRDIPWSKKEEGGLKDVKICVSKARADGINIDEECGFDVSGSLSPEDPALTAYKGIPGITLMDLSDTFIKDGRMHPVVGNVLVYRDSHHITNMFAETQTKVLDEQMFGRKTVHPREN